MDLDQNILRDILKEFEEDSTFNFVYGGEEHSTVIDNEKNKTLNLLVDANIIECITSLKSLGSGRGGEFLFKLTDVGCDLLSKVLSKEGSVE